MYLTQIDVLHSPEKVNNEKPEGQRMLSEHPVRVILLERHKTLDSPIYSLKNRKCHSASRDDQIYGLVVSDPIYCTFTVPFTA
jgi:hypothetical protein